MAYPGQSMPVSPPILANRHCDFCEEERICVLWGTNYWLCPKCETEMMRKLKLILNLQ